MNAKLCISLKAQSSLFGLVVTKVQIQLDLVQGEVWS